MRFRVKVWKVEEGRLMEGTRCLYKRIEKTYYVHNEKKKQIMTNLWLKYIIFLHKTKCSGEKILKSDFVVILGIYYSKSLRFRSPTNIHTFNKKKTPRSRLWCIRYIIVFNVLNDNGGWKRQSCFISAKSARVWSSTTIQTKKQSQWLCALFLRPLTIKQFFDFFKLLKLFIALLNLMHFIFRSIYKYFLSRVFGKYSAHMIKR